jgi:hypothetical protein
MSANALRSIPSGRSPAPRTASTRRMIIGSRAATTITRINPEPSVVVVSPIIW